MTERRELLTVAGVMLALSVATTYPLARQMVSALPDNLGDPLLNAFVLGWDADQILHGLSGLWDAPFFFPMKGTLALSEHLLGIAIFTAPVQWITGNAILACNVAFLASYVLAGVGMYLLARSLWGRTDAAWLGALAFAFAPYRAMHGGHLQVLVSGWMPLALWGLHRYFTTASRRALAVFALAFVLQAWSNGYYLFFFGVTVLVVGAAELGRFVYLRKKQVEPGLPSPRRLVLDLAATAGAIVVMLAPIVAAYLRARFNVGVHRSISEMAAFSATAGDYLRIPSGLWLWSGHLPAGEPERALYPGIVVTVLAIASLLSLRRSRRPAGGDPAAGWTCQIAVYVTVGVLACWMTLGPGVVGPYAAMVRWIPGFDGLRVPARFVVITALALAVVGSAGAAWLLGRLRPNWATAATMLLGSAIVLDGYGGPLRMVHFDPSQRVRGELNAWLRDGPAGALLELPIVPFAFAPISLTYQYNTLLHRHPIVNGYSGYGYAFQDYLSSWSSPLKECDEVDALLRGLRSIGVGYVVLHRGVMLARPELEWPHPDRLIAAIDAAPAEIAERRQFNSSIAWRLAPPLPPPPADDPRLVALTAAQFRVTASANPDLVRHAFDGDIETRWHSGAPQSGSEWVKVVFDRDVDVARLVFRTPMFGIGNHPRDLRVESEAGDGVVTTLSSGSVMPALIRSLANNAAGTPVVLDLPPNLTRVLWLRQAGQTTSWYWTIPELTLFERWR
jgi:hypothetical protein